MISNYVSKMVGRADRFRLHDSLAAALANENVRTTASPVVVLNYRQPDGSMRASILAFQNLGSGPALYYYVVDAAGGIGTPQWTVTRRPSDVSFLMENGILRMVVDAERLSLCVAIPGRSGHGAVAARLRGKGGCHHAFHRRGDPQPSDSRDAA